MVARGRTKKKKSVVDDSDSDTPSHPIIKKKPLKEVQPKSTAAQNKKAPAKNAAPAKKATPAKKAAASKKGTTSTAGKTSIKTPRQTAATTTTRKSSVPDKRKALLDEMDESDNDIESESDEESHDENDDISSQKIYETLEKIPRVKDVNRPKTKGARPGTTAAQKQKAILFKFVETDKQDKAAANWIKRYQQDACSATTELINFIIQCCGSKREITERQFETVDLSEVMDQFHTERYIKSGGDYPLRAGKTTSKFTENFRGFWDLLIEGARSKIIYDSYLMQTLNVWLITFSRSKLRPFRHVATLTSSQIVLSLGKIASAMRADIRKPERLANARKQKNAESTSRLKERLDQMHQQVVDIESLINAHYSGIFKRRFRDRIPLIRKLTTEFVCEWILGYSDVFASDHYFKYIGWALSDSDAECRLAAVKSLNRLCEDETLLTLLSNFFNFYEKRILKLPHDVDITVAATSIELLSNLAENDFLEEDQIKEIFKLVNDANATIRHETAKFVKRYLLSSLENEERIAEESNNQTYCRKFIEFVMTFQSDLPVYIVDAIWDPELWKDQAPKKIQRDDPLGYIFLRDWDCMIGLLIPESGRESELTSMEQAVLTRIMAAAVRKSMGEDICPKQRGEHNIRENSSRIKRNQNLITRCFITSMADLLSKFQADGEKIEYLLQIPVYFDLELFVEENCKDDFVKLVQVIKELMLNRVEESVFANCAKVLKHFLSEDNPYKNEGEVVFAQLCEELLTKVQQGMEMIDTIDDDESYNNGCVVLRNGFSRLHQLIALLEIKEITTIDKHINSILSMRLTTTEENQDSIRINAASIMTFSALWDLNNITVAVKKAPTVAPDEQQVRSLKGKLAALVSYLKRFFTADDTSSELRYHCFLKLLDLYSMFSPKLRTTILRPLALSVTALASSSLINYFQEQMNVPLTPLDKDHVAREKELDRKRKILFAISRAALLGILHPVETGQKVLAHLNVHDDKKIDEVVKLYCSNLRKLNQPAIESRVLLGSIINKYNAAQQEDTENALHEFNAYVLRIGKSFPSGKTETQDTLCMVIQGCFLEAIKEYPERQTLLDGLYMFASKLFPNRASRLATFCATVIEEQELLIDEESDEDSVVKFMAYLKGVGNKKNPSTVRKQLATKAAKKTTSTPKTRATKNKSKKDDSESDEEISLEESEDEEERSQRLEAQVAMINEFVETGVVSQEYPAGPKARVPKRSRLELELESPKSPDKTLRSPPRKRRKLYN